MAAPCRGPNETLDDRRRRLSLLVGWLVGETRETIDEESLLLQALEGFVVLLEKIEKMR